MKLIAELSPEDFEALGDDLVGHIESIEIRQEGGVLAEEREVSFAEVLHTDPVKAELGLAPGKPAIRVWIRRSKEEQDGSNDGTARRNGRPER